MIFCVEDDNNIRDLLVYTLETTGFHAKGLIDSQELWKALAQEEPDLILLDIMLPGEDGYSILDKLKKSSGTRDIPVIMVTAKEAEFDKVRALESGADDYITKPFGMMELMARIRAALRHGGQREPQSRTYSLGTLFVDPARHIVRDGEREVTLTLKEFQVLCLLMERAGTVFTRDQLLNTIWGYEFDGASRTVDVHIRTLRQKLGRSGDCIETVRGVGYKVSTDTRTESVRGE